MAGALPPGRQSLAANAWLGRGTEAALLRGPRMDGAAVTFRHRPARDHAG